MTTRANHGSGLSFSRWRTIGWAALIALTLLAPLVAMLFSDEVTWSAFDFALAAGLVAVVAVMFELAARFTRNSMYRAAVGVALATALLLVWVTGAVGIIGSEDDAANLMYGGVLAVGLIGAVIARFQPDGMARALAATAIAQAVVAVIAISAGWGSSEDTDWPRDILGVTGIFVALWLTSAALFLLTARERSRSGASL